MSQPKMHVPRETARQDPEAQEITAGDLAERLRIARREAGLTQGQAVIVSGLSRPLIQQWEYGRGLERIADFLTLLEALGVRVRFRGISPGDKQPTEEL